MHTYIQFRPNSKRCSVLCANQREILRERELGSGGGERGGGERERVKERERERVYQVR